MPSSPSISPYLIEPTARFDILFVYIRSRKTPASGPTTSILPSVEASSAPAALRTARHSRATAASRSTLHRIEHVLHGLVALEIDEVSRVVVRRNERHRRASEVVTRSAADDGQPRGTLRREEGLIPLVEAQSAADRAPELEHGG